MVSHFSHCILRYSVFSLYSQHSSVTQLCLTVTSWTAARQGFSVLHYIPEFAQTHAHWVDDAIKPSHSLSRPFSSCPQSFPVSGSFPRSWLFESGGQSIGASASASVLPMNIQDWFPLGWTDLISLLYKGLSRVFSNTTVQKYRFFGAQPFLLSSFHICTWWPEKPQVWPYDWATINWLYGPWKGDGTPLQYSCLENPMDGGAW